MTLSESMRGYPVCHVAATNKSKKPLPIFISDSCPHNSIFSSDHAAVSCLVHVKDNVADFTSILIDHLGLSPALTTTAPTSVIHRDPPTHTATLSLVSLFADPAGGVDLHDARTRETSTHTATRHHHPHVTHTPHPAKRELKGRAILKVRSFLFCALEDFLIDVVRI